MSRLPSRSTRLAARSVAASPAVAGFRPASAALAVAAAFALQPLGAGAQSAVHGTASVVRNGANVTVTTTNGANSNHSVLNWQSFSVPANSTTAFQQPSATSTSINRVTGNDPSQILGRLTSNGRLVLVNPAGITVGAGAAVDTAGFTASTLALSESDAIAGLLRFGGGAGGKLLVENGASIRAQGGDIVLIAPNVKVAENALVQSDGATMLVAGQKVEITGRGLEGIHMEVQAGNEAVNLGTLKGDAVGIFANTLRHSGLVHAQALSVDGGKVVLKATGGDNLVSGTVVADGANAKGGSIEVLGQRVGLLEGASVQASGQLGGGSVRVGGDYQGANAAIQNAEYTYVDRSATINADATVQGDGGRVIVWADEGNRTHGRISARGGEHGGNGGFAEVSGKKHLDYRGVADLRAPRGASGTLLLDPGDILIDSTAPTSNTSVSGGMFSGFGDNSVINEADLESQLEVGSVIVMTGSGNGAFGGRITVGQTTGTPVDITWSSNSTLALQADRDIVLNGSITAGPGAFVSLNALGADPGNGKSIVQNAGRVKVGFLQINGHGHVDMQGANLVDTLGANTWGNSLAFVNAQTLRIATVGTAWGLAGKGINTIQDPISMTGGYGADVLVRTTAGDLIVTPQAVEVSAGNVTLQAAQDLKIDGAVVYARGGALDLSAGRDVLLGTMSPGQVTQLTGASVLIEAAQDLVVGTTTPAPTPTPAPSASPSPAPATKVDIFGNSSTSLTAGRNIRFDAEAAYDPSMGPQNRVVAAATTGSGVYVRAGVDMDAGISTEIRTQNTPIDIVSSGGSILGQGRYITSGGLMGTVTLTARSLTDATDGNISFGLIGTSAGSSSIDKDGGTVTVHAGRHVNGGSIDANGGQGTSVAAGNGGTISVISDDGNIVLKKAMANGGSRNGGVAGNGGWITLRAESATAGAGNVTVTAPEEMVSTPDGPVTVATGLVAAGGVGIFCCDVTEGGKGGVVQVHAKRNIVIGSAAASTVGATIQVQGGQGHNPSAGSAAGGMGGDITLFSWEGDVIMQGNEGLSTLYAFGGSGTSGGLGGDVAVTALNGRVLLDAIEVSGGSGSVGAASRGGTVNVSAKGDVLLRNVHAFGGNADTEMGFGTDGGYGGSIVIASSAGSVTADTLNAQGLTAGNNGRGGDGGTITVTAKTTANVGPVVASGGDSYGTADGGNGGTVTISAGGNITIGAITDYGVFADGGDSDAVGGRGGTISLVSSGGSVTVLPPILEPDTLTAVTSPSAISASGGWGVHGGRGGTVTVDARTDINIGGVFAWGGSAWSTHGGSGGRGGDVTLRFGGTLSPVTVYAGGGDGGSGHATEVIVAVESPTATPIDGGAGGAGGTIVVERVGGNLVIDSSSQFFATGGMGGDAAVESGGSGAIGGGGGAITLIASGGNVVLDTTAGPAILAGGGEGGYHSDGSTQAGTGPAGSFSATGTAVEVLSDFHLDATWNNAAILNVRNMSVVSGPGVIVNTGTLSLYDTSKLLSAGLVNPGRLVSFGTNRVDFAANAGEVQVASGSILDAPFFFTNNGTLNVDGRLNAGVDPTTSGLLISAAAPVGPVFTNTATGTISGNGNLVVNGGVGTVDNFGILAPGAIGGVGVLTIGGSLVMQSGSTTKFDLLNTASHDVLKVGGTATTGGTFALNYLPGTTFGTGENFALLQGGTIDAATPPAITPADFEGMVSGNQFVLRATTDFPRPTAAPTPAPTASPAPTPAPTAAPSPAPTPAPSPSPSPAPSPSPSPSPSPAPTSAPRSEGRPPQTLEEVQNSPEVQGVRALTVEFATMFVQEAQRQDQEEAKKNEVGKDDIVVTDTACKP